MKIFTQEQLEFIMEVVLEKLPLKETLRKKNINSLTYVETRISNNLM